MVEVGWMDDDALTAPPLASPSYDDRKSGSGSRAGRGVEVRVREVRRRVQSPEDRLRIVRETLEPGVVVQVVADRHGVSTGQLYTWRKQMLATAMAGFVPVEVVAEPMPTAPAAPAPTGGLEIAMPSGVSLRITGSPDAATLRLVLAELARR